MQRLFRRIHRFGTYNLYSRRKWPHVAEVVLGSDWACVKIVPQDWIYSERIEMTESTVPLTARVACAG